MSCNYADGLSPYENKGVLGVPERFEDEEAIKEKCEQLAKMILASERVVVHTGAGISTAAGIPDFRSPNGVWTLERKGLKPTMNVSFNEAIPTKTHMALKALVESGHVKYIVSQNIDGLHLRSGLQRQFLAELHGNMYVEQCNKCHRQFVRNTPAPTVGQKETGGICKGAANSRPCRGGRLIDTILDWEDGLPEKDLDISYMESTLADLNICLGTTLQIVPSGNLPIKNKKQGGKVVICNLQPTKHDKKADLIISTYVDDIMVRVLKKLGLELLEYSPESDPTTFEPQFMPDWTISSDQVKNLEKIYNAKVKERREMNKKKRPNDKSDEVDEKKSKILIKTEEIIEIE
ncbi:NAD-dependent protein deacetylase Sirt6 [Lutzomyia longipalpis]|uniref:NAD-dependent protein deacetylase Sirt6 n=1 Tax=Lutzomyia longipalpis TaxID=7200 RepID=UPI002483DA1D|nr:NAD-dependent protein deacetylase Sirt6 [Lutzomyia longipalpis]